jgi:aerobic C4-dicarboxylate transport protein
MAEPRRPWYTVLYIQVLIAIAVGVLISHFFPSNALGDELEQQPV